MDENTRIWFKPEDVAYREPGSPAVYNTRVQFVEANYRHNKRGYDVLVFIPPDTSIEPRKTVTLYRGVWHELLQDKHKQPFLGQPRADIHDFDGPVDKPDSDDRKSQHS
jgi:hypothetical protein